MQLVPVSSTVIAAIGYDAAARLLYIRFHSRGTYIYPDVPESDHSTLMRAGSIGTYFSTVIKNRYRGQRI